MMLDKFVLTLEVLEQFPSNLGIVTSFSSASQNENTFMEQTCSNNLIA
jgi:hypothetical protein